VEESTGPEVASLLRDWLLFEFSELPRVASAELLVVPSVFFVASELHWPEFWELSPEFWELSPEPWELSPEELLLSPEELLLSDWLELELPSLEPFVMHPVTSRQVQATMTRIRGCFIVPRRGLRPWCSLGNPGAMDAGPRA
jgi:hypothetical protein